MRHFWLKLSDLICLGSLLIQCPPRRITAWRCAIQLHPNTSELNFDSTKNNEKTMKVKTLQKQFHDFFNYDGCLLACNLTVSDGICLGSNWQGYRLC